MEDSSMNGTQAFDVEESMLDRSEGLGPTQAFVVPTLPTNIQETQAFDVTNDTLGPTQAFDASQAGEEDPSTSTSMEDADAIIDSQVARLGEEEEKEKEEDAPLSPQEEVVEETREDDDDDGPKSPESPKERSKSPQEERSPKEDSASKSPAHEAPGSPDSPVAPAPDPLSDSEDSDDDIGRRKPTPASSDSNSGKESSPTKGARRVVDSDEDSGDEIPAPPRLPQSDGEEEKEKDGNDDDDDDAEKPNSSTVPKPESDSSDDSSDDDDNEKAKDETEQAIDEIFGGKEAAEDEGGSEDDSEEAEAAAKVQAALDEVEGKEKEAGGEALARSEFQWDFDVMLKEKKAERGGNRRRRRRNKDGGIDLQGDEDDRIREAVAAMKEAADDDRRSNKAGQPAVRKRKMLPLVVDLLRKADYREALVEDFGVVPAIAEWLAPLPDRSLPALEVRTQLLAALQQIGKLDGSVLRRSGIGKSVMILYKHPRETKVNRTVAGKLIAEWSRPIFELDTDYRKLSKKEREERDYQLMPAAKKARLSRDGEEEGLSRRGGAEAAEGGGGGATRPGEKGWIGRARVPKVSTKDYVVRPKSSVEGGFKKETKVRSGMAKKLLEYKNKQKAMIGDGKTHAVAVSIEGRKMSL